MANYKLDWNKICQQQNLYNNDTGIDHVYDWVPNHHTMISGSTGDGKTALMNSMIINLLNFTEIIILTSNKDERLYAALDNIIQDKVGEDVVFIYDDLDEFPEVTELETGPDIHRIVIFDDVVTLGDPKIIKDYFAMGRKHCCQCFYLTQSYFSAPVFVRNQCKSFIFFLKTISNGTHLSMLRKAMFSDLTTSQFDRLRKKMNAHDFVLVDLLEDHPCRYRLNMYDCIYPNKL